MSIASVADLVEQLRKSRLLDPIRLDKVVTGQHRFPDALTLARELVKLAASCSLGATAEPEWTPARAASLLRDLPEGAREIIRLTVEGNGWADAGSIRRGEGTSPRRRTGSISRAIKRGVTAGRLPEGLPVPLSAQYDPSIARTGARPGSPCQRLCSPRSGPRSSSCEACAAT